MRNVYEILREKELQIEWVKVEVEALRIAAPLLGDETEDQETVRRLLKMGPEEGGVQEGRAQAPVVIHDPRPQAEMMAKLLEHKCEHLQEMRHLRKQRDHNPRLAAAFGNGDLALRYESQTFKEFRNAIELYQQLKKDGL
jgi:hypothetical protein